MAIVLTTYLFFTTTPSPSFSTMTDAKKIKSPQEFASQYIVFLLPSFIPPVVFSRLLDGWCLRRKYDTPFLTPRANIFISRLLRRHPPLPLSASSSWFRIRMKWFVACLSHCSQTYHTLYRSNKVVSPHLTEALEMLYHAHTVRRVSSPFGEEILPTSFATFPPRP